MSETNATADTKPKLVVPLTAIQSTAVKAWGYSAEHKVLAVQFHGRGEQPGRVFHYKDVPPHVANDLQEAKSFGRALAVLVLHSYAAELQ